MNTSLKMFGLALIMSGLSLSARAQVKFKLSRTADKTYTVSLIADKTLSDRQAITGTIQVSMKVRSAEGFELGAITSLQPEVIWDKGTLIKSPDGARDYDYISVALTSMATRQLAFVAGKEVPLFTLENAGQEVSEIALLDNVLDPLATKKDKVFNVQNHISVLGFGRINAYTGNVADTAPTSLKIGVRRLFPNPAKDKVTVEWVNYLNLLEGEVNLSVVETGTGRVLTQQTAYMRSGSNSKELNVEQLPVGQYIIYLERGGIKLGSGQKLLVAR